MRLIGPAVRNLLHQYGISSGKAPPGTGRNGILLKGDVLKFVKENKLKAKTGRCWHSFYDKSFFNLTMN